jgi:hypothetical protein
MRSGQLSAATTSVDTMPAALTIVTEYGFGDLPSPKVRRATTGCTARSRRVPPVASRQPCRPSRRTCRGQAARPNGAKLRRGAPYPRLATGQARARRSPSADMRAARMSARRKQGWPDPLRRRQESPAQARHAPAPVQVAKAGGRQRSSWSGAAGSVLAGGFSGSCQKLRPVPEPDLGCRRGPLCCCFAVFCCCTRPVNCGFRFSNLSA